MRTITFAIVLVFTSAIGSLYAQDLDSLKSKNGGILIQLDARPKIVSYENQPLYILTVDNKRLHIPKEGKLTDSLSIVTLKDIINPDLIKSINILKLQEATEKYGSSGKNGVILIDLKNGSLEKLPVDIQNEFQDY